MSYRLHDFECPFCAETGERIHSGTEAVLCSRGHAMTRLMSAPRVQTIETHLRGTKLADSFGGYHDHNLRDLKTGEVPYITSVAQKNRILKERGFIEVGPTDVSRDQERSRGGRIYSRS